MHMHVHVYMCTCPTECVEVEFGAKLHGVTGTLNLQLRECDRLCVVHTSEKMDTVHVGTRQLSACLALVGGGKLLRVKLASSMDKLSGPNTLTSCLLRFITS